MPFRWTTTSTPIGELLLVATHEGLVRVAFECEDFEAVLRPLQERSGESVKQHSSPEVETQLAEYFAGVRRTFDIALDWQLATGFRGQVQRALCGIGYGCTESYTELAHRLGNPKAVRAVGSGCATNPLPIVAPCHRVLRSDGSLGGYRGGLGIKQHLLNVEAAHAGDI